MRIIINTRPCRGSTIGWHHHMIPYAQNWPKNNPPQKDCFHLIQECENCYGVDQPMCMGFHQEKNSKSNMGHISAMLCGCSVPRLPTPMIGGGSHRNWLQHWSSFFFNYIFMLINQHWLCSQRVGEIINRDHITTIYGLLWY